MSGKKWVPVAAVGILATAFAGSAWSQATEPVRKPAAVVNGVAISMEAVEAELNRDGPSPIALPEERKRQLRKETLDKIIEDQLMQQFLSQNAPRVDPAKIDERMEELQKHLKEQAKTLADFCRDTKQTEAQIRASVTNTAQWHAFVNTRFGEAELKAYYERNRDFFDGVLVKASHIELRVPANTSDADRSAARDKLLALRQEIVAGKLDFAEAAKKYSQSSSAAEGGDIGYFHRKLDLEEPFAKAAFALKVGEVSDVVQTEAGLHLIKVTDRKPGIPTAFDTVREDVVELCDLELRMAIIEHQRKVAKIEINLE